MSRKGGDGGWGGGGRRGVTTFCGVRSVIIFWECGYNLSSTLVLIVLVVHIQFGWRHHEAPASDPITRQENSRHTRVDMSSTVRHARCPSRSRPILPTPKYDTPGTKYCSEHAVRKSLTVRPLDFYEYKHTYLYDQRRTAAGPLREHTIDKRQY